MGEINGLHWSKGEVYQEIDLQETFGVDVSTYSDLKTKFAQACIDYITKRCASGLDFRGRALPPYSPSYIESDVFQAYGKSPGERNEKLKGDMLAALDVISNSGNKIRIGWNDKEQAEKARGHITGYEGHPTIKGAPKREFFGLTSPQLKQVALEFDREIKSIKESGPRSKDKKSDGQMVLEHLSKMEAAKEQQSLGKLFGIEFLNDE